MRTQKKGRNSKDAHPCAFWLKEKREEGGLQICHGVETS